MSDFVKVKKLTSATGGTVNFPNGINIAGSDSGVTGAKHTVSGTEPSTPANGDTWYDTTNEIYYVRMDNAWKNWLGSSSSGGGGNIDDGSVTIANYYYDAVSFDTGTANPNNMHWKPDGTKVYILTQASNGEVLEINLSTAYDLSTATDSGSSWSGFISQASLGGYGLHSSTDGTKFYILNYDNDVIYQYSLSTAWDISTASYANKSYDFGSGGYNTFDFNDTGTKIYVHDSSDDVIETHTLSTAWDISTASYDGTSSDFDHTVGTSIATTLGITFSPDGTSFFIMAYSPVSIEGTIFQWDLTTAYDLSTASLTSNTLNVETIDSDPVDIRFSSDGTKLYLVGRRQDAIYQFSTTVPSSLAWSGDRAIGMGGQNEGNRIQYFDITTKGNAIDFGDLYHSSTQHMSTFSNGTRGCAGGGGGVNNVIQYITIATTGNSQDFGDLLVARYSASGCSDGTYGLTIGGFGSEDGGANDDLDSIEYVTIATLGNGTDFGNLLTQDGRGGASAANATRGIRFAGQGSSGSNVIQYVTIATPGNATDFGDLLYNKEYTSACADATRAVCAGGDSVVGGNTNTYNTNIIEYVTIATTGNSTDLGDLTSSRRRIGGTANSTRGVFLGGTTGTGSADRVNTIDYITIQVTEAIAADFGDLLALDATISATSGNAS